MDKSFWLRKIDPLLFKLDSIPLLRGEPFSFEDLSQKLKEKLQVDIEISSHTKSWQKGNEIFDSSIKTNQLCFTFAPLIGNVYFLIPSEDVSKITALCLTKNANKAFASTALEDGFYRYLTLLGLKALQESPTFENLSFKLVEGATIKSKEALCLDIKISINKHTFFGKIALTPDFIKSWNEFFSYRNSISLSEMQKKMEVPIQIVLGKVTLKKSELETLKNGDFVILDEAHADPKQESSNVLLSIQNIPLFRANIKKNKIQIVDFANYYEENIMEESANSKKNEEIIEEASLEQIPSIEEPPSALNNLPMELTVELAKISMTLEKLMQLQPGNFLELSTSLENPVNITVNGKKIARAELATLGETLGIRILEI